MPFVETVGRAGAAAPAHRFIAAPKENVGVTLGLTVTLKLDVVMHWPGGIFGVKI